MAVTLPDRDGWKDFEGGGSNPELCDQGIPPSLSVEGQLACLPGQTEVFLEVTGGVPPFTWASDLGVITPTGLRTATLSIHVPPDPFAVHFFRPFVQGFAVFYPDGQQVCNNPENPANTIRTEATIDVRLVALDCVGNEFTPDMREQAQSLAPNSAFGTGPFTPDPIGTLSEDRSCVLDASSVPGEDITPPILSEPDQWSVEIARCTTGEGGPLQVTVSAVTAGKTAFNGLIHAGAANFSETIEIPMENLLPGEILHDHEFQVDFEGVIDVRTQAMVDAQCCVPAGNIVATVTDATGEGTAIEISVN